MAGGDTLKIAFCVKEPHPEAPSDERFGRCPFHALVDIDSGAITFLPNTAASENGAGVKAARALINAGANCAVVSSIGPKAFEILKRAGIKVYAGSEPDLPALIEGFKQNRFEELKEANQ